MTEFMSKQFLSGDGTWISKAETETVASLLISPPQLVFHRFGKHCSRLTA